LCGMAQSADKVAAIEVCHQSNDGVPDYS
jgi:hypothetical protein